MRSSLSVSPMPRRSCRRCRRRRREGLVDGLAILAEHPSRVGEPHLAARRHVHDLHVALEAPRDDPHEGDAVAVLGIHVRLDLEDEAGEGRGRRVDRRARRSGGGPGLRCVLEEPVEQQLHAEVVHRAAEEDRREFSAQDGVAIEVGAGALEHLDLLAGLLQHRRVDLLVERRVVESHRSHRRDRRRRPWCARRDAAFGRGGRRRRGNRGPSPSGQFTGNARDPEHRARVRRAAPAGRLVGRSTCS